MPINHITSMGPRNLSRGNFANMSTIAAGYSDFNGAAEFKPRKYY